MIFITMGLIVFVYFSNHAAFAMGHSRGCLDMLKRLKQLNQEFALRSSDDANFNKVKKEFTNYLIDIQPKNLPTPSLWDHIWNQDKWKDL